MNAALSTEASIPRLQSIMFGGQSIRQDRLLSEAKAVAASLPLVAQTLVAGSTRISMRRGGPAGGSTNGKRINIMQIPLPRHAADLETFLLAVAMGMGLVHHEVGHVNHTDFKARRNNEPLHLKLSGIVEDVRQEREHIAACRTGRKWLNALDMAFIITGLDAAPTDETPPVGVFTAYLMYQARVDYRQEPWYQPLADAAARRMEVAFPAGMTMRLRSLMDEIPQLKDTREAINLSRRIQTLLEQELEQAKQQQQQAQQQQSGQPDPQNSAGQPGDQGQNGDPQQGQPDGQGQSGQGDASAQTSLPNPSSADSGNGAGGGDATAASGSPATPEQIAALEAVLAGQDIDQAKGDRDDAIKAKLNELAKQLRDAGAEDATNDPNALRTAPIPDRLLDYGVEVASALSLMGPLASRLRSQLHAQSTDRVSHAHQGLHIDPRVIHRVATGGKVFRHVSTHRRIDTAVYLLCDVSGSMAGHEIDVASKALYATACALHSLPGVSVGVGTFPGFVQVLPFGQHPRRNEVKFRLRSHGGTPLHDGIVMARRQLSMRPEPRKLLMVVTDGQPDSPEAASAQILAAERSGLEVLSIGIGDGGDCVRELFRRWCHINEVNELPKVLLGALGMRLMAVA